MVKISGVQQYSECQNVQRNTNRPENVWTAHTDKTKPEIQGVAFLRE